MGELQDILVNIGAIAGFAAIVGLAVLAMLYFSQARDVRRLREWAGREPERAAEVELRAQQIASQAIAQAYESMALRQSEAQAAAGIAEEQGVAVAPVVQAAVPQEAYVAEGSATAPAADGEEISEPTAVDEQGNPIESPQPVAADPHATQAHDVLAEEDLADEHEAQADDTEPEAEDQPAEAQLSEFEREVAASNGSATDTVVHPGPVEPEPDLSQPGRPSHLAPSTPAAARAGAPLPPLPPLDTSEFQAVRPPTPPIPDYYLSTETTGTGSFEEIEAADSGRRNRVPFAVAGVLVAIFAVILIATQLTGGTDEQPTAQERREQREAAQTSTGERNQEVNRPAVTISLLNGTSTPGLASLGADALKKADFTDVTTGNRNDGVDYTTSTVYYASGSKLEAEEVAKELGIKDVKEADEETLAAGGSVPVIVVLGADFDQ